MDTLKWWQKTAVYQVYPRSFQDTTGSGEGDIPGITRHLDYLKALGIGAVWLTPVYPSPMVDNGYDISDYTAIDRRYGTLADMEKLIAEGKKRDIRIVMDLVYNHTSDRHDWFQESKRSRDNDKADWYIWRDAKEDGSAPTNWRSIFGGSAWTWCEERQQYYLHTFAVEQPDLNWENPDVRQALYDAANFWLDKGVGGFRIDAIVYIKKPAVFEDGPVDGADGLSSIHQMIANTPGILDFLHEFRSQVFDGHDIFTVAEANGVAPEELPQWVGEDGVFSMLFEFSHSNVEFTDDEIWCKASSWPLTKLKKALSASQRATADNGWYPIFFENHDRNRCVNHYFPEGTDTQAAAKAMATVLFGLRGTPFIYEGQELGMANTAFERIEDYNDISTHGQYQMALEEGLESAEALKVVQFHSRDNARTPMQWTTEAQAGFTTGTPWLPVHDDFASCCAEVEEKDDQSVLSYYRKLQHERFRGEASQILLQGSYEELLADDESIYAFKRTLGNQAVLILVNFTNDTVRYNVDLVQGASVLIGNFENPRAGELRPAEAVIYRI
ncbi:glycoside hydrolase family 13 protein [Megasphaera massiliensis]|uniref:glycoside hydrolase family 13 protein n=1 Tax=Megasphaera massiliensis TaxID=1232428 RepID=UPI00210E7894|nr:alpha,alpha-phosphotrehalase [Megasphaera massiliensis]MCQ5211354.1 alpha-glucosidase [Megasphaera massiliensis]